MRKFFLSAAIILAASTLQAQTWTSPASWSKSLTPVTAADQLGGTKTAVAADGSVYTTGTFNQNTAFGSTTLDNPDALTSAYIAKYNADGTEAWAVSLYGSAVINAITTDAEGNVYAVGNLADKVVFNSADANSKELDGMAEETKMVTGFLAKYDAAGNLKAARVIIPVANAEIMASTLYSPISGDIAFTPNEVQVADAKVYVSARYTGDVTIDGATFPGSYIDVWGFMYMDQPSMALFTVDAADLTNGKKIACLQAKENKSSLQQSPESVRFTVADGTVYAAFVGKGTQLLSTPSSDETLEMAYDGDNGVVEHAFILAKITGTNTSTAVFHVSAHDKSYGTDAVGKMIVAGDKLYVGGTYYGELGFDKTKSSTGSSDLFVASINTSDFTVNWAATDGYDEGDVTDNEERFCAMLVGNDRVFIAGVNQKKSGEANSAVTYNAALDGTIASADNVLYAALADNGNGKVAAITNADVTTTVSVFETPADAISHIGTASEAADGDIFTVSGQAVGKSQKLAKGIYISRGKKVVVE